MKIILNCELPAVKYIHQALLLLLLLLLMAAGFLLKETLMTQAILIAMLHEAFNTHQSSCVSSDCI